MMHARADVAMLPPENALEQCRRITREHSKTFYLGSRFFRPQQRKAVWAVYAACRTGDDIADETNTPESQGHLEMWWHDIQHALQQHPVVSPVHQALAWAAQHYPIPQEAFYELYLGLQMDLQQYRYHTMPDLELYCRRVAGVVGFMIAPICGYSGGETTLQQALKLGMAMQLTNILRDVGEDWQTRERIYLPTELLAQFNVPPETIKHSQITPEYVALMQYLIAVARAWYREGERGIPALQGSAKLAVAVAAKAYEGILDALEQNGYDNLKQRAYVSGFKKLQLIPRVWWSLQFGAKYG